MVSGDLGTSRRYIEQQYADDRNLAARQSIYAYQHPRLDLWSASVDLARIRGDEVVLDVGCGNGRYLSTLRERGHQGWCAEPISRTGCCTAAVPAAGDDPLLVSDAQALPFAADTLRRRARDAHAVPRARSRSGARGDAPGCPAGRCRAGAHELRDRTSGSSTSCCQCAARDRRPSRCRNRAALTRFKVEAGMPELKAVFADVTLYLFSSELVVDARWRPVVSYAQSMGDLRNRRRR